MSPDKIIDLRNANAVRIVTGDTQAVKPLVKYKQVVAYGQDGEIVYDVTKRTDAKQNGGGFVISYTEKMCEFLEKCSTGATVRVFLYIAHHQGFGNGGVVAADNQFGYRCTHKFLQQVLRLDRKSVYNALKSLKDNFLVNETKINGASEFMVNPNYVTVGTNKKERMAVWNSRWAQHWKEVNAKKV